MRSAVLEKFPYELLGFSAIDAKYEHDAASYQRRIDKARSCIEHMEPWVAAMRDPCLRDAYQSWIRHFRGGLNEAEEEIRTHAQKAKDAAYSSEYDKKRARIKALAATLPEPPACPAPQ